MSKGSVLENTPGTSKITWDLVTLDFQTQLSLGIIGGYHPGTPGAATDTKIQGCSSATVGPSYPCFRRHRLNQPWIVSGQWSTYI